MIVYLKLISNTYIDTIIIKELSDRRVLMSNLTISARNLELLSKNQEFYSEKLIKDIMLKDIESYKSIISKIENKMSKWDSKTKDLYKSRQIKAWDLIGKKPESIEYNLINIMKVFVSKAIQLHLTDLSSVTYDNPDFYYLYRNGYSESLSAINESITFFTVEQEKITESILLIVLLLAMSAIILMILCFIAVLAPTLYSVEKSNKTVWRLFYLLPLDLVQEMRSRCEERLEMTHGIEPEVGEEGSKFKKISSRRLITPKRKFLSILLRISLYYLLSMGLFIFFYYFAYSNFGELLKLKPRLLNLAGLRTFYTNSLYFWIQEIKYENTNYSYKYIVQEKGFNMQPKEELKKTIYDLLYVENELIFGGYKGIAQSSKHFGLIFEDSCWNDKCEILSKGLHSGVLMYIGEILNARMLIDTGRLAELEDVFNRKNELQYGEQILFDLYDQYITDYINFYITTVIWVTSTYCLIVMALYFFVYIPIINSVRGEITKVWRLGRLIPIEHRTKIMAAFKIASGKT